MATPILQPSFAAGELSPNLYARVDLAKYKVGAALMRNMFADFRGGASNRPGTQFITQTKVGSSGQPRLIPFIVGQEDSFMLVFGDHYMWSIQTGVLQTTLGVPNEISTPYAVADLPLLKFSQTAKVLTLTHPSYPPQNLTLSGTNTFTLAPVLVAVKQGSPTSLSATATNGGDYCYGYVVSAVSLDGKEESLASVPAICHTVILDPTKGFTVNLTWTAPTQAVSLYKVYKWGPLDDRQASPATVWGYIGSSLSTEFTDNNIAPDFTQEAPSWGDPFSGGQFQSLAVNSGGSGATAFSYIPLVITDSTGTGAAGYAVVDHAGVVSGVFLTNSGKNYSSTPSVTAGSATFTYVISNPAPLYPATSTTFSQRQTFGGSNLNPETIVLSEVGAYGNFSTTPVSLATDAISADLASSEVNTIKSFQNVAYGLIVFTTGGTFLLSGGSPGAALTPSSINSQAQASNGANDLPPLRINYSVLYVQNKGNIVRDLSFAWQRQSYTGSDISTFANHLFYNSTITEWTWCEEPNKLVWAVRNDGVLLSLSYVPDQEVTAWSHHDTNGWFRSVASVPEGSYNVTYFVVQRLVGGSLVYYVERLDNRIFSRVEDCWFLDCALALPQGVGNDTLILSAASGSGVTLTSANGTFNAGMVGSTLWGPSGKATVTAYTNAHILTVDILTPFPTIANDPNAAPAPLFSNTWSISPNVTTVSGLSQLNGLMVSALVDGMPIAPQLCVGGSITLPFPASKVVAGLAFQSQLQTLRIDTGSEPTTFGKRKMIPSVTIIVDKTLGLKAGGYFNAMSEISDLQIPYTAPYEMVSAKVFLPIGGDWNTDGQVCFQQDYPLPLTILGVIPEVTFGDTQR